MLYKHFNDHLKKSCNSHFDGIIQTVPSGTFLLLLSLSPSNLSKPFGNLAIAFIVSIYEIKSDITNSIMACNPPKKWSCFGIKKVLDIKPLLPLFSTCRCMPIV